jgi:hypothetical protein
MKHQTLNTKHQTRATETKSMPKNTNRRDFAKKLALLAATPLAAPMADASAQAQGPAKAEPPTATEALTEIVRQRYGKFLDAEQLKSVQRTIERHQRGAEVMKQFKLTNGDEPAFVFNAEVP